MKRFTAALGVGGIDIHEFAILAWLYAEESYEGTLAKLHKTLGWAYEPDHLSKRLRRLREKGIVAYTAGAGRSDLRLALEPEFGPPVVDPDRIATELPTELAVAGIPDEHRGDEVPDEEADRMTAIGRWRWRWPVVFGLRS